MSLVPLLGWNDVIDWGKKVAHGIEHGGDAIADGAKKAWGWFMILRVR